LTELCASATTGGAALTKAICGDYDAARCAAAESDWRTASAAATRAAQAAPALLPVRKLQMLCLRAAGLSPQAENLRRELVQAAPGDPDLARWQFGGSAPFPRS